MCVCGVGGEPGKTAGLTLRGAAMSRTLQEGPNVCLRVSRPPGAGVSTGRTTVRDASAIPCRGALGLRAERGIWDASAIPPGQVLDKHKWFLLCGRVFFRSSYYFFVTLR